MSVFRSTHGLEEDDPILSLNVAFRKDERGNKVNLGIGAYKCDQGKPYVLPCVRKAETQLIERKLDKEYLPIEGIADYLDEVRWLVLGKSAEAVTSGRVAAVQTIGATSALRIGGEYLALQGPRVIYVSDPTWSNHHTLFGRAGLTVKTYPYFNKAQGTLNFPEMCRAIEQMTPDSAILLHGCCHNPTGVDPTPEQWKELCTLIKSKKLFPFFDLAYQGFAAGLEEDAWPLRHFAMEGLEFFAASSYSKNFGLYGERVGALLAVCSDRELALKLERQLKSLIRGSYSTPPSHGARIVAEVLRSEELKREWQDELKMMRQRIQQMRRSLVEGLEHKSGRQLAFLKAQHGLFSYGLLKPEHVGRLRDEFAIFMPGNGRINVAGLNPRNLDYVIDAFLKVMG